MKVRLKVKGYRRWHRFLPEKLREWLCRDKDKIIIHDSDTWNVDVQLAKIIVPMLERYKELTNGSPFIYEEDYPEHIKVENGNIHEAWDYVLDEMIFAFKTIRDDTLDKFFEKGEVDHEAYEATKKRMLRGLEFFGKYYLGLWW